MSTDWKILCVKISHVKGIWIIIQGIPQIYRLETVNQRFIGAVETIFGPLARLLVARRLNFGLLAELMKIALVRAAIDDLVAQSARPTDSRISIATGVHRKDIKRLKGASEPLQTPKELSITSQVVAKWLGTNGLIDPKGNPVPIARKKQTDEQIDFEDLVRSISKDIRPRAVLDELLDRGVISVINDETLVLHPSRLTSNQDDDALSEYFGMNIHDHLAVTVNNLLDPEQPQLERCVHYQGLSKSAVEDLAKFAEAQVMAALIAFNMKCQETISDKNNHGSYRINFGAYVHHENQTQSETEKLP
jgi:hypothetical protein